MDTFPRLYGRLRGESNRQSRFVVETRSRTQVRLSRRCGGGRVCPSLPRVQSKTQKPAWMRAEGAQAWRELRISPAVRLG